MTNIQISAFSRNASVMAVKSKAGPPEVAIPIVTIAELMP